MVAAIRIATSNALALFAAAATLLAGALAPATGHTATITVFAAASLKEALDAQARRFEADSGNRIVLSYGGSNGARQADRGRRPGGCLSLGRCRVDGLP
jgi:molybdate transport system substrate-binding protein